ncbi:translation initiation factor IF-2 N-terminal domain-containing protein, partial [Rhabdothermincola sediminis]|uniref:translation initiation factor IF-2 N-terminal domain-containing protein n=1 Tax=Rhabdothermincola sediminis TaxID=2751370 RepID=UPI001AA03A1D
MPSNIRVYELARELGLTNKECLDLCESLGIGVKSHSSSVVEAQADRVRRKAEREGLIRDQQPEEPGKAKKAKKAAAKPTAAGTSTEAEVAPDAGAVAPSE